MRTVNITCENTHQEYEIELGTTLRDVKKIIFPENHNHILGALVNNQLQDLQFVVMTPLRVNFIDVTTLDGYSIYSRSLIFVLYQAVAQLFPKKTLRAEYFISNGIFCRIVNKEIVLTPAIISELENKMKEINLKIEGMHCAGCSTRLLSDCTGRNPYRRSSSYFQKKRVER